MAGVRERRERFIREYLVDHNGTQAVIRAGYSATGASVTAVRLLADPKIRAAIDAADAKVIAKLDVTRETILEELARIAFANALDYGSVSDDGHFAIDLSATTRAQFAAVHEIKTRTKAIGEGKTQAVERFTTLKLANKREALVDLGRALGLFKDDPTAGEPVVFIIKNLYVNGEPDGRASSERPGAEEYVDPARKALNVR